MMKIMTLKRSIILSLCRTKERRLLAFTTLVFVGCVSCLGISTIEETTSLSTVEYLGSDNPENVDMVFQLAHRATREILPDASLTYFSYISECPTMLDMRGEYIFYFTQSDKFFWRERVYVARVEINTLTGILSTEVKDESEHYPSTEPLELTVEELIQATNIVHNTLESSKMCESTIVLGKSSSDSPWDIRCGPPDQVFVNCMELDLTDRK